MRGSPAALLAALLAAIAFGLFPGPAGTIALPAEDRAPRVPRPAPTPDTRPAFRRARPEHRPGKAAALVRRTRNAGRP